MNLSISLRPTSFKDVYNQVSTVKELTLRTKEKNWPVAMLLKGPYGTGKSSCAQIIAMTINCKNPDNENNPCGKCSSCKSIIEEKFDRDTIVLDGSTIGQKGDVIEFSNSAEILPIYDKKKVLIIEEADQLSTAAKNALHKILEKPRSHVHFILISMETTGLPPSIQSRCQTFQFKSFSTKETAFGLKSIMEKQGLWEDSSIPDTFKLEGLFTIAQAASGSFRDAIQFYEKCLIGKYFTKEEIRDNLGIIDDSSLNEILKMLLDGNVKVFEMLKTFDTKEFYKIAYKALIDAYTYKIAHYIDPKQEYFENNIKALSDHVNLTDSIQLFQEIYTTMGSYFNSTYFLSKLLWWVSHLFPPVKFSHYKDTPNGTYKHSDINTTVEGMPIQAKLDAEAQARAFVTTTAEKPHNPVPSRTPSRTRL